MPEIRLTDAQLERLEAVRAELEAEYVVSYGHVRQADALDYLLDTYTPPANRLVDLVADASYEELQHVAATVDGVPGSGIGKEEMRSRLLEALGRTRLAGRLTTVDGTTLDEDDDTTGPPSEQETETETRSESTDPDDPEADDPTAATAADETAEADETTTQGSGAPSPGGSPLQAVAQLLEQNDDVWRESDGETRYEVDLPDGTTEPCRTKDDVKRLLFKHYR
jgi:hypothetical protein